MTQFVHDQPVHVIHTAPVKLYDFLNAKKDRRFTVHVGNPAPIAQAKLQHDVRIHSPSESIKHRFIQMLRNRAK